MLDNIRSLYNVGSIFRTADSVGVDKIYLCGFTPTPVDRFGKVLPRFAKVALGAERNVDWEKRKQAWRVVDELKRSGYRIFAVEQDRRSIPYRNAGYKKGEAALVLGNEVDGLSETILSRTDRILEIPMLGIKKSLNVSVAFGIVAFSLKYKDTK